MYTHATPYEDPDIWVPVEPTLVRVRPNLWTMRDAGSGRPLACEVVRLGAEYRTFEWTLLPEDMADRGERIRASKTELHGILRARYRMETGRRLRPGIHSLERWNRRSVWMSADGEVVAAVRARLDELEAFDRRLDLFERETGARPQVTDETCDASRILTGAVTGDTTRLPGEWRRIEYAAVDARAVSTEAHAALDALDPPGAARIPGLPARIHDRFGQCAEGAMIGLLGDRAIAYRILWQDDDGPDGRWRPVSPEAWERARRRHEL